MEGSFWQHKTRSLYIHCPIFKMKLYKYRNEQSQQPYLMFHLPCAKKIVAYTSNLQVLVKTYKLNQQPNAFQIVDIQNNDYLVTGTKYGKIQCQSIIPNQQNQSFQLNTQRNEDQTYINDIALIDNHKIVNCFNNGSFCFWNLKTKKKIHSIENVHENYTYKIRKINQKLLSCGNDCKVAMVDLYKGKKTKSFLHSAPVWCAYPINQNIFTSVGLFNKINVWDLRTDKLCQTSLLQNDQSSFITRFNEYSLIFGDGNTLKLCDLRKFQISQQMASANMLTSAENIIVTQNGGYVCGRGFQVNHFIKVPEINFNSPGTTKICDPYANNNMYLYSVPQQNDLMEQQLSQESENQQQQWQSDQEEDSEHQAQDQELDDSQKEIVGIQLQMPQQHNQSQSQHQNNNEDENQLKEQSNNSNSINKEQIVRTKQQQIMEVQVQIKQSLFKQTENIQNKSEVKKEQEKQTFRNQIQKLQRNEIHNNIIFQEKSIQIQEQADQLQNQESY